VGLVRIDDIIISSERSVEQLREYRDDSRVAGVVLRLDSPGGAVAPSQEIYREVLRFRSSGKPIVASMGSVAASGAYYVACAADCIFASPGTITGSIGVLLRLSRWYRLFGKIGIETETIKSGKYKDIGSPAREMTPEERRHLQGLIDDTYEQFVTDVAAGRAREADSVRALADGRVYTGRQALAVGLVDTLGGLQDAVQYVRDRTGLPAKAKVCERRARRPFWWDLASLDLLRRGAATVERTLYPAGIYYLYADGL
jgi:protease-4